MDREVPPWIGDSAGSGPPEADGGHAAGVFIVALLLAALGMTFAALLVGYVYLRTEAPVWPPPGTPPLPYGLWASTAILVLSGATMQLALRAVRAGRWRRLRHTILATLFLAIAFLGSQAANWYAAVGAGLPPGTNLLANVFYLLTGLHAAHVIGGLIPLALVTVRALRGLYWPGRHAGVVYMAMYWHFVGVVWLVLFVVLLLAE